MDACDAPRRPRRPTLLGIGDELSLRAAASALPARSPACRNSSTTRSRSRRCSAQAAINALAAPASSADPQPGRPGADAARHPGLQRGRARRRHLADGRRDRRLHRRGPRRPRRHRGEVRPRAAAAPHRARTGTGRTPGRSTLRQDRAARRVGRSARQRLLMTLPDAARRARRARRAAPARRRRASSRLRVRSARRPARASTPPRRSLGAHAAGGGRAGVALLGLAAAQPALTRQSSRRADAHRRRGPLRARHLALDGRFADADLADAAGASNQRRRSRLRAAIPQVPAGVATLTDRVLPDLLPVPDVAGFDAVVERGVAIESPPPVTQRRRRHQLRGARRHRHRQLLRAGRQAPRDRAAHRRREQPVRSRQASPAAAGLGGVPVPRDPLLERAAKRCSTRTDSASRATIPIPPAQRSWLRLAAATRRTLLRGEPDRRRSVSISARWSVAAAGPAARAGCAAHSRWLHTSRVLATLLLLAAIAPRPAAVARL